MSQQQPNVMPSPTQPASQWVHPSWADRYQSAPLLVNKWLMPDGSVVAMNWNPSPRTEPSPDTGPQGEVTRSEESGTTTTGGE